MDEGTSLMSPDKTPKKRDLEQATKDEVCKRQKLDADNDDQLSTPPGEVLKFDSKTEGKEPAKKAKEAAKAEKEAAKAEKEAAKAEKAAAKLAEKQRKEAEKAREKQRKEEERAKKALEREAKKQAKEAEREQKRLAKEAERLEKEKERLAKEEERQRKAAERETKRLVKEAELEEKKRQKLLQEEEKERAKKAAEEKRAKQSITNFFQVKKSAVTNSPSPKRNGGGASASETVQEQTPDPLEQGPSAYDSYFQPFFTKTATVADHRPPRSSFSALDELISTKKSKEPTFASFLKGGYRPRDSLTHKASDVTQTMNLGLTDDSQELFQQVPQKYIQFYENVKPPYHGTFSLTVKDVDADLLADPFAKVPGAFNYDYDSDLEEFGDEDEEGEEIGDDDEDDDEDDEDSSEIDEFVEKDNENSSQVSNSKRKILGPLLPETRNIMQTPAEGDLFGNYFGKLGYKQMRDTINTPIDPFHDYWKTKDKEVTMTQTTATSSKQLASAAPMTVRPKTITNDDDRAKLSAFIKENSSFSVGTLAELAQKQVLSQYSRSLVKHTIQELQREAAAAGNNA